MNDSSERSGGKEEVELADSCLLSTLNERSATHTEMLDNSSSNRPFCSNKESERGTLTDSQRTELFDENLDPFASNQPSYPSLDVSSDIDLLKHYEKMIDICVLQFREAQNYPTAQG